jgi:O-antigen ligase
VKPLFSDNAFVDLRPVAAMTLTLALLMYAALGAVGPELAEKLRYGLVIFAIWAFFAGPRELRSSPVFLLLGLACLVALLSWAHSLWSHPDLAEGSPKINRLTNWLAAIPIAYALGGQSQRSDWMWVAAAVALLLAPWISGEGWDELRRGLSGVRVDFALHNAGHTGLYYAVLVLGLLATLPRALRPGRWRPLLIALWSVTLAGAIAAVLFSQTRSMWLGLSAAVLLLGWLQGFRLVRHRVWRWAAAGAIALALVLILLAFLRLDIVSKRISSEESTISSVLAGRVTEIALGSVGIRIHSWRESLDWIAAEPLLGWGGQGRSQVIVQSDTLPQPVKDITRHLHNSYLDVAVNYGLAGLLLMLSLWGWLIAAALSAARSGHMPIEMLHFFLSFMVLWAIANAFESFVFYTSGTYVFGLVSGYVLSCIWRSRLALPRCRSS